MIPEDNAEAIEAFQKSQIEKLDAEVPQILQQVDAKILINYLKGNPNGSTVNIINVGRLHTTGEGGNGQYTEMLVERLMSEIAELKLQLAESKKFGFIDWMKDLEHPRFRTMIRSLIITLKEHFAIQREACQFLGVTERQFSYWMKTYQIPGYRPRTDYRRREKPC